MAAIGSGISLPPCTVHRLAEVAELITSALSSDSRREKLALVLKKERYIPKLLELFQACEELQLSQALQHLPAIMLGILWLGQTAVLEVMLSQECIRMMVVGESRSLCLTIPNRSVSWMWSDASSMVPLWHSPKGSCREQPS